VLDDDQKLVIENPVSIRERVYEYIRNRILSGKITPATRMVETQLAKEIGTSRTPVREALHVLEMEGLLEAIPRVGYRVKELKWEDVEEICEIRAVNEVLACRWAMRRITPEDLKSIEDNLTLAEAEIKAGHPESFVERDAEFHELLVKASGSERLLELCSMLRRHMLRYRVESLYLPETALRAIAGHRRILDCLREKNEEDFEAAVREHLEQSKQDIHRYAFDERHLREDKAER
jgi:DNA-binding GntR family transcriptional regulator